jgi:hypothetical protein
MRIMGDPINTATSSSAESLNDVLTERADLSSYRRFMIQLIAPAGSIEVYAQEVVIEKL